MAQEDVQTVDDQTKRRINFKGLYNHKWVITLQAVDNVLLSYE